MFHRILVPVDDSELTDTVIDTALHLAASTEGTVTLLHVHAEAASLDPQVVKTDLAVIEKETADLVRRATSHAVANGLHPLPSVSSTVRAGPLEQTILDTAQELRSQLIVMGTHGRKGVADRLLGSSAERVVAHATCAVLVVKPEGFPFLRD